MVVFPNAKINIGLNIINKRPDGFHNIETIFYPIGLSDALEFIESPTLDLTITGQLIEGNIENNLVVKTFRLLQKDYKLPEIKIHLHKAIPSGAGLGGGSSDAAFMLCELNKHFQLGLSIEQLKEYAAKLGSDCAFFVDNTPSFAHGRGELLEKIDVNIRKKHILLVKPNVHVSTAEAYRGVKPSLPVHSLKKLISQPLENWKHSIVNDFEKSIFPNHPVIEKIKVQLYEMGAIYASMSGSGSSVYGIFNENIEHSHTFADCFIWKGEI